MAGESGLQSVNSDSEILSKQGWSFNCHHATCPLPSTQQAHPRGLAHTLRLLAITGKQLVNY